MIAIIAFFGYAVQYIQRIDMSVAIVCMVNNTAIKQMNEADNIMKMGNLSTNMIELANDTIATNLNEDKCLFKAKKGDKGLVWN